MLSVIMPNNVMLSVIMSNVVLPIQVLINPFYEKTVYWHSLLIVYSQID